MTETLVSCVHPLQHFVKRLQTAEIIPDPYPHYCLDHVFPEDFYQSLLRHLPGSAAYQNLFEITTLKLDHFRFRDQRDLADGWTASLPDELRRFWDEFNAWFLGPELAQAVLDSFAEPMRSRFGERALWPAVSVETQLIRHQAGYFLGPHSDLSTKLVVLLIYLVPDDNHQHLGTSLYRPKELGFTCPNSTHYPFERLRQGEDGSLPAKFVAGLRAFGPVVSWRRAARGTRRRGVQPRPDSVRVVRQIGPSGAA